MFKCIITEHYGPFCGQGGWGSDSKIGMDRSPKKAVEKAKAFFPRDGSQIRRVINPTPAGAGGGVPILHEFRLFKNGELIKYDCN
jgi:hypothetical protein